MDRVRPSLGEKCYWLGALANHLNARGRQHQKNVRFQPWEPMACTEANMSVKNIVAAMGTAVLAMFRSSPLRSHRAPSCRHNLLTHRMPASSALNISFCITSNGLVSTAPATPAVTDFLMERSTLSACEEFSSTGTNQ